MKVWLANLFWDALWIFLSRVHDWAFDPKRAAAIRFRARERWWAYHVKAASTATSKDDDRANFFQTLFDFKTSPDEAVRRGDLDPRARAIAMRAVEATRSRMSGEHQP